MLETWERYYYQWSCLSRLLIFFRMRTINPSVLEIIGEWQWCYCDSAIYDTRSIDKHTSFPLHYPQVAETSRGIFRLGGKRCYLDNLNLWIRATWGWWTCLGLALGTLVAFLSIKYPLLLISERNEFGAYLPPRIHDPQDSCTLPASLPPLFRRCPHFHHLSISNTIRLFFCRIIRKNEGFPRCTATNQQYGHDESRFFWKAFLAQNEEAPRTRSKHGSCEHSHVGLLSHHWIPG